MIIYILFTTIYTALTDTRWYARLLLSFFSSISALICMRIGVKKSSRRLITAELIARVIPQVGLFFTLTWKKNAFTLTG